MDKNIEALIDPEKLKIIEQRQQEAEKKDIYRIAETTIRYLSKKSDKQTEVFWETTVSGGGHYRYATTFKEEGLVMALFEKFKWSRAPAAIRIENDNQLVFEGLIEKHSDTAPTILEVTAYNPGKEWEGKLHEHYAKADAIRQERLKQKEKEEKLENQRKAKEILHDFGL